MTACFNGAKHYPLVMSLHRQNAVLLAGALVLAIGALGCSAPCVAARAAPPKASRSVAETRSTSSRAMGPRKELSPVIAVPPDPEAPSGFHSRGYASSHTQMVVTAHPLATKVGLEILLEGGSAIDAAIAAQMVLGLVEPQSSGIGGGGFLVYYDGEKTVALDGRETAPARAKPDLFLRDGKPMPFREAVVGGRAVGTPGLLAMLELAHRRYGVLPWARLMQPARRLCTDGFRVGTRLATLLRGRGAAGLRADPEAANYFFDTAGNPLQAGTILKNPRLAETLEAIASQGAAAFYRGPVAREIAEAVQLHPGNPGLLDERDLARYEAKERPALCFDYRDYRICGMPPPSSGALAVGQVLRMLEARQLSDYPPVEREFGLEPAPHAVHLISEGLRLAFADRAHYVADPDFVAYPGAGYEALLDRDYLAARSARIGRRSMGVAEPGKPFAAVVQRGEDASPELPSTTHLSIVDARGCAVALTTSIESGFGSRLMVRGFLLNNELTDFSFLPMTEDGLVANRVEGGKRPRSSMTPTLVFHLPTGKLVQVTGSPGGAAIISFVLKTLVANLDWRLGPAQIVALPNFGSRNGPTELEHARSSIALKAWLEDRGHEVVVRPQTSGVSLIVRDALSDGAPWLGAADPRREGLALGGLPRGAEHLFPRGGQSPGQSRGPQGQSRSEGETRFDSSQRQPSRTVAIGPETDRLAGLRAPSSEVVSTSGDGEPRQ